MEDTDFETTTMEDIDLGENSSFSENCTLWGLPCAQVGSDDDIKSYSAEKDFIGLSYALIAVQISIFPG